jgi:uncharacterized tellurite resistance protein B-like protein
MSLMARAARQDGPDIVPLRLSPAEAFAAILVAAVAADGELSAAESARLNGLLASSRVLSANPPDGSPTVVESALAVLTGHGLPATLTACAEALPANLRPTAFAQATDLVLADARIGQRENAFIEALRDALGINHALALRIVDVILIKNRA